MDKEVERIRFKLKANPIYTDRGRREKEKLPELNSHSSDFYSLPKRNIVKPPKSRYEFKLNDINKKSKDH